MTLHSYHHTFLVTMELSENFFKHGSCQETNNRWAFGISSNVVGILDSHKFARILHIPKATLCLQPPLLRRGAEQIAHTWGKGDAIIISPFPRTAIPAPTKPGYAQGEDLVRPFHLQLEGSQWPSLGQPLSWGW